MSNQEFIRRPVISINYWGYRNTSVFSVCCYDRSAIGRPAWKKVKIKVMYIEDRQTNLNRLKNVGVVARLKGSLISCSKAQSVIRQIFTDLSSD